MSLVQNGTRFDLTRQEKLLLFIRRDENLKSVSNVARKCGLSISGMRRIFYAETAPPNRVRELVDLGIPEVLLPIPFSQPLGPRPKKNIKN